MIKAGKIHKERVTELLAECLDKNKTVNWIVKQDNKRRKRVRDLIDYSFEACIDKGLIYMTDNQDGVIICSLSDDKLPVLKEAYLTARFILTVCGVDGIAKALRREQYVNAFHPRDEEFIYIWYIAVDKAVQGKGTGSSMLQKVIDKSNTDRLSIYVETSAKSTLAFYEKHGFGVYHVSEEEMFGFQLYFLRRLPNS